MMRSIYKTGFKIQVATSTSNGFGGFSMGWADTLAVSGYIRELSGDERLAAAQKQLYSTHRFYCDIATAITETKRLVDPDNNIYDIRFPVHKNTGGISFTQADVRYTGEVAT